MRYRGTSYISTKINNEARRPLNDNGYRQAVEGGVTIRGVYQYSKLLNIQHYFNFDIRRIEEILNRRNVNRRLNKYFYEYFV